MAYQVDDEGWRLAVSDNGTGKAADTESKPGLGTSIVEALGHQLGAEVKVWSSSQGTQVSIIHGKGLSRFSDAA